MTGFFRGIGSRKGSAPSSQEKAEAKTAPKDVQEPDSVAEGELDERGMWLLEKLARLEPPPTLPSGDGLHVTVTELQSIIRNESPANLFGLFIGENDKAAVAAVRRKAEQILGRWREAYADAQGVEGEALFDSMFDGSWEEQRHARQLAEQKKNMEAYLERATSQSSEDGEYQEEELAYAEGVARISAIYGNGNDSNCQENLAKLLASEQPLHDLTLGWWEPYDVNTYDEPLGLLAVAAPPLKKLFVGDFQQEECEISWAEVGDVGQVMRAIPSLEVLKVRGGGIGIEGKHEKLEALSIESGGLNGDCVRALAGGHFPSLRTLRVWFGTDEYGGEATIDAFAPFFSSTGYPSLRELGIENTLFSNEAAKRIVASPLAAQLEALHFDMGTMTDEGAVALAEGASAFPKLKRITFNENFIEGEGTKALEEAFGERLELGLQEEPDDWGDELYYYVSVSE